MTGSLQIKNNKFYILLNLKDENGKRKLKWISTGLPVKGNKRAAEQLLKEAIQEYEGKHVAFSKKVPFADFLTEWMEIKKLRLKASTVENYRLTMNSSIIPYFRELGISLQDLHPTHIQNYYSMKLDKGLSAHTILKHHSYINGAMKYALSLNLIPYNPASRVTLPSKKRYQAKFLKAEEIVKLLELVKDEPIRPVILLTVFYGLRRSEVLGLRWQAVDFDQGTILVSHTAVDGSQVYYEDTTKNRSSHRTLPLLEDVRDMLVDLQRQQQKEKRLCGDCYDDNDYICKWPDGSPFKPNWVSNRFKTLLKKSDLPVVRFHDLRHSCASLLLHMGHSLKEIQDWLGHADITTTANIYAHLDYRSKLGIANSMQGMFSKKALEESGENEDKKAC